MPLFSLSLHCRVPLYTLLRASWPLALRFLPVTAHLHCETTFSFQGHTMQYSHFRDLHVLYKASNCFCSWFRCLNQSWVQWYFKALTIGSLSNLFSWAPVREGRIDATKWIEFLLFFLCCVFAGCILAMVVFVKVLHCPIWFQIVNKVSMIITVFWGANSKYR